MNTLIWRRLSGVVATLGLMVALATAAETRVEWGGELNGAWLKPEGTWDGRVVILAHGFASDMNGPADSSKRFAQALAEAGIASLRVNYRGEGDAARTQIESTAATRVADTETVYGWLAIQAGVDVKRVGVVGWSLGGATAIQTAAAHPEWFRSLVLWSSVSGDLYAAMTHGELAAVAAQAAKDGVGTYVIAGWKTVTLKHAFFESFRGVDLDAELATYRGAFLSVRGSEDYLPMAEARWLKRVLGRPAEAVLIAGADHIFNVFAPETDHLRRVMELTVTWLERTL
jgi:uncharacterized protein